MVATNSKDAWRVIAERSWSDDAFRQELINDPNKVLAAAGVAIPAGVNFVVVENEPDRLHLVLPCRPGEPLNVSDAEQASLSEYNAAVVF